MWLAHRGPQRGKLARGETIVTAAGRTVTPDECLAGDVKGEGVVIIDCPDESYIAGLEQATEHIRARLGPADSTGGSVRALVHTTAPEVVACARYQSWMASLSDCQHLMTTSNYDASLQAPSLPGSCTLQVCPRCAGLPAVF